MDLSKIKAQPKEGVVNALIEIPFGSHIKYELDKESGAVVVDRMLHSAVFYPINYGFVPNTLADDGDPIDILVLNEQPLAPGCVIKCRLIGVLMMEDESGLDEKLLAVPISKIDPGLEDIKSWEDISPAKLAKIKTFFETYKLLEPKKWVKVQDYKSANEAQKFLQKAIKAYK